MFKNVRIKTVCYERKKSFFLTSLAWRMFGMEGYTLRNSNLQGPRLITWRLSRRTKM
jgi:hypothetical protein